MKNLTLLLNKFTLSALVDSGLTLSHVYDVSFQTLYFSQLQKLLFPKNVWL